MAGAAWRERGVQGLVVAAIAGATLLFGPAGNVAASDRAALFERVAGAWSGGGTAVVAGGSPERIRCRAVYSPQGASQLHLTLRCASDAFNLQVESDIARDGERIVGTWTETSVGVSGNVSGVVGPDRLRATVAGMGVTAQLSLTLRGDLQGITLVSGGQFSAAASLTLRRA